MTFYVYVLLCANQCFYTGYTRNVEERFELHMNGKGARYTKMHKPEKVVYIERLDSKRDAMRREKQIKKMNHRQKQKLVDPRTP